MRRATNYLIALLSLIAVKNRKTLCYAFPNHFVRVLKSLTQNKLRFFVCFPSLSEHYSKAI